MKQAQGITEQLKADSPMEWAQRLNSIRACAMEIVGKKLFTHNYQAAEVNPLPLLGSLLDFFGSVIFYEQRYKHLD